jgi:hypothetical protein
MRHACGPNAPLTRRNLLWVPEIPHPPRRPRTRPLAPPGSGRGAARIPFRASRGFASLALPRNRYDRMSCAEGDCSQGSRSALKPANRCSACSSVPFSSASCRGFPGRLALLFPFRGRTMALLCALPCPACMHALLCPRLGRRASASASARGERADARCAPRRGAARPAAVRSSMVPAVGRPGTAEVGAGAPWPCSRWTKRGPAPRPWGLRAVEQVRRWPRRGVDSARA